MDKFLHLQLIKFGRCTPKKMKSSYYTSFQSLKLWEMSKIHCNN